MFNSLWSQPKNLALNSESRICRISEKGDNLVGYIHFSGNFCSIRFSSRNSQNFRLNGSLLEISTISRFSGNFLQKFPYPGFGNMGNLPSGVPCFSRREGTGVPCSFPTRKKIETPHRRLKYEYNGKRPRKTLWGDLIFGNFLQGIIVIKLNFPLSGILVWMVRFADFVFLPDFLENVHRKFPYHLSPFLNFRNLRLDEKLS